LYDPNGWDWKFEERTLSEQLIRIANKLISDKPKEYLKKKEKSLDFDSRDIGDIYDVQSVAAENIHGNEEVYSKLVEAAYEVSKDDDNLNYFTIRYFEGAEYSVIAEEMGVDINKIHVYRKKLLRRLICYKPILEE